MATATPSSSSKSAPVLDALGANGLLASVDRKALTEVFVEVTRSTSAKGTLPILGHVLLDCDTDGYLSFSATDLYRQVSARLPGTVTSPGRTTVPARALADWLKIQDQGPNVTFRLSDADKTKCSVECGKAHVKLPIITADDWPTVFATQFTAAKELSVGGQELKEAIHLTALCVAPDDTRPVLAGIMLKLEGKQLTFAAADGFRLAVRELDITDDLEAFSIIVPGKAMEELARLIDDEDAPIHIAIDAPGKFIRFETPSYTLFTSSIEGQFPDYQRIIPTEIRTVVQMSRQPLIRGTAAAMVVADGSAVRFTRGAVNAAGGGENLLVSSTALDGSALDEIPATFVDRDKDNPVQTISLNGKYVHELLKAMPTDTVQWQLNGSMAPLVARPVGSNGYLQVLMPMHVADNKS